MRKRWFAIGLMMAMAFSGQAQVSDYQLVWSDEFDGTTLNQNNWTYETGRGNGGWGTGQLDYATNTENNVKVDNGTLKLVLRNDGAPDGNTTNPYTSGRIMSFGKQSFRYGRIEARIKGVDTQGLGFAFWTLGDNYKTSGFGWPRCGEIDIMENTGKTPSYNISTLHYSADTKGLHTQSQVNYTLPQGQKFVDDFHIFGMEWTPDYIQFYVDDFKHSKIWIFNPLNFDPFHKNQFFILSVGVGGSYSGAPNATTVFPMTAEIDWVRVYQNSNSTAIDAPTSDTKMQTFPNPATDQINVQLPLSCGEITQIDLYNMPGQWIKSFSPHLLTQSTGTLPIDDLKKGNYLLKISTTTSGYTTVITKQ